MQLLCAAPFQSLLSHAGHHPVSLSRSPSLSVCACVRSRACAAADRRRPAQLARGARAGGRRRALGRRAQANGRRARADTPTPRRMRAGVPIHPAIARALLHLALLHSLAHSGEFLSAASLLFSLVLPLLSVRFTCIFVVMCVWMSLSTPESLKPRNGFQLHFTKQIEERFGDVWRVGEFCGSFFTSTKDLSFSGKPRAEDRSAEPCCRHLQAAGRPLRSRTSPSARARSATCARLQSWTGQSCSLVPVRVKLTSARSALRALACKNCARTMSHLDMPPKQGSRE
eukprot:6209422-Pleurochrysis_carterae.AAC.3